MFGAIQLKMLHVNNGEVSRNGTNNVHDLLKVVSAGPHFRWDTCLRTVAIFPEQLTAHSALENSDVFTGETAYEKLLELICGLHSPLIGETEVFGQFKEAVHKFQRDNVSVNEGLSSAFNQAFRAWSNGLLEDAKQIRKNHLQDIGSQSYGSLVRRELRELGSVSIDILGAGRLVADILPWITKPWISKPLISRKVDRVSNFLTIHCRDLAKAQQTLAGHIAPGSSFLLEPLVPLVKENDGNDGGKSAVRNSNLPSVLLIAAPMSGIEIQNWLNSRGRSYDLVLDLRGESRGDLLSHAFGVGRYVSLEEFFQAINETKQTATKRREAALSAVRNRREERESMAYHRPFGWDDV
jgi:glutamyl-tRNA reductase